MLSTNEFPIFKMNLHRELYRLLARRFESSDLQVKMYSKTKSRGSRALAPLR